MNVFGTSQEQQIAVSCFISIELYNIVGSIVPELNGETIRPAGQLKREPHIILNASEKSVNGNGGCNSFFGSYELQGDNGITISQMGSTRMACPNDVMQVERQLFQAFEMTYKFTHRSDTLFLTKIDMSPLAKFVVSDMK